MLNEAESRYKQLGSDTETESELESKPLQNVESVPLVVKTHFGRFAGSWALTQLR